MIKAIIELKLVYPYKFSISRLADFCSLWNSTILYGGTHRPKAIISMPSRYFKMIFGCNPQVKEYIVPRRTESFIEALQVKALVIK